MSDSCLAVLSARLNAWSRQSMAQKMTGCKSVSHLEYTDMDFHADFALIIRAISVLEGVALVGDPNFAIVDEAYPYIAKRLLTDDSPRLQEALRYMVSSQS